MGSASKEPRRVRLHTRAASLGIPTGWAPALPDHPQRSCPELWHAQRRVAPRSSSAVWVARPAPTHLVDLLLQPLADEVHRVRLAAHVLLVAGQQHWGAAPRQRRLRQHLVQLPAGQCRRGAVDGAMQMAQSCDAGRSSSCNSTQQHRLLCRAVPPSRSLREPSAWPGPRWQRSRRGHQAQMMHAGPVPWKPKAGHLPANS